MTRTVPRAACVLLLLTCIANADVKPGRYEDLLALFREWRAFQQPVLTEGVPDYTAAAMARQRQRLPEFQRRLDAIGTEGWTVAQKVDVELVRAEMNGLDFDHRVLRPWSRNPCFYAVVIPEESDTPAKEGPAFAGAIPVFRYTFPLPAAEVAPFRTRLKAIPVVLAQAKTNLVEDARDLWTLGIRVQAQQAQLLADLARTLAPHHPDLARDAETARAAVLDFRSWLEAKAPSKKGPSGIGAADYDWYLKHVHLSPYTWHDEVTLMRRELDRATAHLKLEEARNRTLPPLSPPATPEEWRARFDEAADVYIRFLTEKRVMTMRDYAAPALRARFNPYSPAERRDFFQQVDLREPLALLCHDMHWIDLARMRHEPHPSPIRRGALLYNIWDQRAEGLATAMEEMMMTAGLYDARPRGRELVWVMAANRAARGLAGLLMHGRELDVAGAVQFAHDHTPRGWLKTDGDLAWGEQQNYLEQPGYGTSYLTGKLQIEALLAERARQQGDAFTLQQFMDDFLAAGLIPVSLIRREMSGGRQ